VGIVQSTKTDSFFGIVDTTNGDLSDGEVTGLFTFDISGATLPLSEISIDFAAMGDFESSDLLQIGYSIDGGAFTEIFSSSVDEDATKDYTMEDGDVVTVEDPLSINGVEQGNSFQTVSASISGSGNQLALQVFADTNGGSEAIGFDNITITAIPEPSSLLMLSCVAGLVGLRRRR
jgi:hypothetical protein